MKIPNVPSEGFLNALPDAERKKLGRAGMTSKEAQAKFAAGQEKKLQKEIYNWLSLHGHYFETDRMDRKPTGRKGRADFRICVGGLWLSLEAKSETGTLSKDQIVEASRLRKSGGKFSVCFSLQDAIEAVRDLRAL
jgi:hypothetical protein